jgi:sucrose phosphorylase
MNNKVQLITYADRFGQGQISDLHRYLLKNLKPALAGGVHLLPFFAPIDGADAGYDPINHDQVDARIGNWEDIKKLSGDFPLTVDLIVNHISDKSEPFLDVKAKGSKSPYFELFLTKDKVFPNGATEEDINKIYRPRPNRPFSLRKLDSGEKIEFWTTFSQHQLDIDVQSEAGKKYLHHLIKQFSEAGVKMIRLDAIGYAIKKAGSSCFMLPETFDLISEICEIAHSYHLEVLCEIHAHHEIQKAIAERVDYVYDFVLPPLVLYTLFTRNSSRLKQWLAISPKNCLTVLDTHDGIGVMDVADVDGKAGILSHQEIDLLVNSIHKNSNDSSKMATGAAASNLDLYQVNSSYYDALGGDDQVYLIARAIQFFCPGIPQVYYGGLLASANDINLLEKTKVGRDINRPYLNFKEVDIAMQKPVVQKLLTLMEFRNTQAAFNGEFSVLPSDDSQICLHWQKDQFWTELKVDLKNKTLRIESQDGAFTLNSSQPNGTN